MEVLFDWAVIACAIAIVITVWGFANWVADLVADRSDR